MEGLFNQFGVAATSDGRLQVMGVNRLLKPITHDEALSLAAWLVALTAKREEFNDLLNAVENT